MNTTEKLKKIKRLLLGEEEMPKQELETAKLIDGVVVEIEGDRINVVTEEGERIPAPAGQHTLEDGRVIVVEEDGVIAEILLKDEEKEVEMSKESFVTKADFDAFKNELLTTLSSVELKEEPKEEIKVELEKVELKEEPKKLTHSPEKEAQKGDLLKFARSAKPNTKSLIYKKLFN